MDIQGKRKELTELVDNIKEHSDRLTVSHTLPALELSVLLSKISKLYEEMIVLKHELSKVEFSNIEKLMETEVEEAPKEIVKEAKEAEEKRTENLEKQEEVIVPKKVESAIEEKKEEPIVSETVEDVKEEVIEVPIEKLPEPEVVKTMTPYEIDFQDLNTKLSGKEDNSVVDQLQKQPISDLTTAIGLNERYLYSNELFGGNMELFRAALKELNNKANFSEALAYFNEDLLVKHNWNKENELVHSLKLLVARRFK
jgi:hypothetical protein